MSSRRAEFVIEVMLWGHLVNQAMEPVARAVDWRGHEWGGGRGRTKPCLYFDRGLAPQLETLVLDDFAQVGREPAVRSVSEVVMEPRSRSLARLESEPQGDRAGKGSWQVFSVTSCSPATWPPPSGG